MIVTATRRAANVVSVPLSVHALGEDALTELGATGFADYARTVPGLSFTQGSDGEKQTIRGISSNQWFEVNPATALYLDEVPITSGSGGVGPPYNPDPMLVDINRIEVLRGPQGTLFGASALGGAIRIITNQPDLTNREAFVGTNVSTTEDGAFGYGLHGMVNMPLDDGKAAIRAVAFRADGGGYVDNLSNGEDDVNNKDMTGARVAGTVVLSDRFSLTARAVYQDYRTRGSAREEPNDGPRKQTRVEEPRRDEWANYNLVLDADFGWGSLLASTSYFDRTNDTTGDVSAFLTLFFGIDNPLTVVNAVTVTEAVQEVRLISRADQRVEWIAGVFYQAQDQDVNQDFPSPGFDSLTGGLASLYGPPDNLYVGREHFALDQIAVYGELSHRFTDRLELTAGLRWFDINRDFHADDVGLLFVRGQRSQAGSSSESGMTPRFAVNYERSKTVTLYGNVAKGFRPGGANSTAVDPACLPDLAALGLASIPGEYESDSLWSYEFGAKFRRPDGNLQLDVAAYHTDWSGMQTTKQLNCGVGFIENAGAADVDGAEVALVLRPLPSLTVTLAGTYTDGRLSEDVPNLAASVGDRVPGVPRFAGRVGADYHFLAFHGRDAFVGAGYAHTGDSFSEFSATAGPPLPAYHLTDFRFGVSARRWSTELIVSNASDERGILFAQSNILGQSVQTTRPRTVTLGAMWNR